MKTLGKTKVTFEFPFIMEQGEKGLVYLTSPMIPGFMIAEKTGEECLRAIPKMLQDLAQAVWDGHK